VLAVSGELDIVTGSKLAQQLAGSPSIHILDLSAVRFIDAAGLRSVLDATRTNPKLVIRAPSACVRRLCALAGLEAIPHTAEGERTAQPGTVPADGGGATRVPGGCRPTDHHPRRHWRRHAPP